MKKKSNKTKIYNNREGSILVVALMILVIISTLGITVLTATSSNLKQTSGERDFQSVYYIAEAGINQTIYKIQQKVDELSSEDLSHEDFFQGLNNYINNDLMEDGQVKIKDFEDVFSKTPEAMITIKMDDNDIRIENENNYSKASMTYNIKSLGKIDRVKRSVSSSIEIAHGLEYEEAPARHPAFDYVLYSGNKLPFKGFGGAEINGSIYAYDVDIKADGTKIRGNIVSENNVEVRSAANITGDIYAINGTTKLSDSNVKMKGNINSKSHVSISHSTEVIGKILTEGNVELKSSNVKIHGDIHAGGNVELGSTANVNNIFTGGNVDFISDKIKVNGEIHAGGNVGNYEKGTQVEVDGNIYSLKDVVLKSDQSYKFYKDVYAGGDIINGASNIIYGKAIAAGNVDNKGSIKGLVNHNGNPIKPQQAIKPDFKKYNDLGNTVPLYDFEAGDENIIVNNEIIYNINPGRYGELKLGDAGSLKFTGGNYYFNNIEANKNGIQLHLDFSKGPINIYAKEDIVFRSNLNVVVSEDGNNFISLSNLVTNNIELAKELAGSIYWEAHGDFILQENQYFIGTILADHNIKAGYAPKLIGAYSVNKGEASLGYGAKITYAPPRDSAAGNNNGLDNGSQPGNSDGQGPSIIPAKSRIRTSKPIRED